MIQLAFGFCIRLLEEEKERVKEISGDIKVYFNFSGKHSIKVVY